MAKIQIKFQSFLYGVFFSPQNRTNSGFMKFSTYMYLLTSLKFKKTSQIFKKNLKLKKLLLKIWKNLNFFL